MQNMTTITAAIVSSAKDGGFDPTANVRNEGTALEVINVFGAKTVGMGMVSFSVDMYLAIGGDLRVRGTGRAEDGTTTAFRSRANVMEWLAANS